MQHLPEKLHMQRGRGTTELLCKVLKVMHAEEPVFRHDYEKFMPASKKDIVYMDFTLDLQL